MAIDVDALRSRGVGYLNVAHDRNGRMLLYNKQALRELTRGENQQLREGLLNIRAPYHGNVTYAPGAQFWVHRSRILARPRVFYERLYKALTDRSHPLLGRISGHYESRQLHNFFAEAYWHVIFGEREALEVPVFEYEDIPVLSALKWPSLQRRYPCDTPSLWARRHGCTDTMGVRVVSHSPTVASSSEGSPKERLLVGNLRQRNRYEDAQLQLTPQQGSTAPAAQFKMATVL
eukprot:CAMPEP_0115842224 /NCGR_PEP_ID=MMETSP0287-20121206/7690_1 /TAXON_ID=412157 /ORGANISM="Chrysochromulina rotalis, Strain UIO044" /LENGTH=232 /DNA_ID=CAMNT_0003295887 /DNA_START=546 /DNA_END=1244 /DNA_ORIENTATION=+